MQITVNRVRGILLALNWQGHIELPDIDIAWLAREITQALTKGTKDRCENCGSLNTVIVFAKVGNICEDCIEDLGRMAEDTRDALES